MTTERVPLMPLLRPESYGRRPLSKTAWKLLRAKRVRVAPDASEVRDSQIVVGLRKTNGGCTPAGADPLVERQSLPPKLV